MATIFTDNSLSIGRTPLVRLNRITPGGATVLAKIEGAIRLIRSSGRIGAAMIWDAEKRGLLGPGKEIVEPTSGNTGIALAFVAAARGIPITLTMPETMSLERRKVLKAFGANLVLTPGAKGMTGAVNEAEQMAAADPGRYVLLHQFKNPANPAIHEQTTGPEIWEDTAGQVDVLISGVGTGGTLTGIFPLSQEDPRQTDPFGGRRTGPQPGDHQRLAGEALQPGPHKIQGIGAGFIPETLDLSLVDRVEQVTNDEAIDFARRLAKEEGLLSGISCGAAVAVAARLAAQPEFAGKTIVVILPDSGERYLTSVLFEDIVA